MVNNSFFINMNKNYIHSGIIAQSIEVFPKFQEFLKIHNISKCFFLEMTEIKGLKCLVIFLKFVHVFADV